MYSFPRAATKYHKWDTFSHNPAGWKSTVSITGLKPSSGQDTTPPPGGPGRESAPCSFSFWGFPASLSLRLHLPDLSSMSM